MKSKAERCATLEQFQQWIKKEMQGYTDEQGPTRMDTDGSVQAGVRPHLPVQVPAANAALSLLNLCCFLLDRQIAALAEAFEREGGFTERLYRIRQKRRRGE